MKFSIVGSKIFCSRIDNTVDSIDNTVDNGDVYRQVVEFDANVDKVPPHVAARLTTGEIEALKEFMADRRRIQANPAEKNILEVLPGLLREATDILDSTDTVNAAMHQKLSLTIADLNTAFRRISPSPKRKPTLVKGMQKSEAQKERLESIKRQV